MAKPESLANWVCVLVFSGTQIKKKGKRMCEWERKKDGTRDRGLSHPVACCGDMFFSSGCRGKGRQRKKEKWGGESKDRNMGLPTTVFGDDEASLIAFSHEHGRKDTSPSKLCSICTHILIPMEAHCTHILIHTTSTWVHAVSLPWCVFRLAPLLHPQCVQTDAVCGHQPCLSTAWSPMAWCGWLWLCPLSLTDHHMMNHTPTECQHTHTHTFVNTHTHS